MLLNLICIIVSEHLWYCVKLHLRRTMKNKSSNTVFPCWRMTLHPKAILGLFLFLSLLVFLNLFTASTKMSSVMNVSRIRSDVLNTIHSLVNGTNVGTHQPGPIKRYFGLFVNGGQRLKQNVTHYNDVQSFLRVSSVSNGSLARDKNTSKIGGNIRLISLNASVAVDTSKGDPDVNNGRVNIFGNVVGSKNNTRQGDCNNCFKHNFKYLIQNDHICEKIQPDQIIDLIILVTSTHRNINARTALRKTWLSISKNNTANVRFAFLLGEDLSGRYKELVRKENDHHHDIIKEDFVDSYSNLTYKTIMGFKWAATKCSHAKYVMKTDDDMFVNVPNVLRLGQGVFKEKLQTSIAGLCSTKAVPIRNKKSKWYASLESYPEKNYPGFCSGTGYVTSMNVARKVYEISPSVPFFHLEDVYVSLCIRSLGFHLLRIPGFNSGRPKMDPCIYKGSFLKTSHRLSPSMLMMIWNRTCRPRLQIRH